MQENLDLKFRAAWEVFARTCSESVVPEATYQAWFAHYLISQFGIDRVAREPSFSFRNWESPFRSHFRGGQVKLDAVVLRSPGVNLGHYATWPDHRLGGLEVVEQLAIVSELKVASTQGSGLDHTEVARDFYKLSMLLEEAERHHKQLPLAYVCILANHKTKAYNLDHLRRRLEKEPHDARVVMLHHQIEGGTSE